MSRMFEGSFKGVSVIFKGVSRKFKGCFKEVLRMFHASFKNRKFQWCFKKVSGVFQGRLRGVLRKL